MVQKSHIKVPFKEAVKICVVCGKCKTEITLSIDGDEDQRKRIKSEQSKSCPICGTSFSKDFSSALAQLVHWYELASSSGHDISLVIDLI